MVFFLHLLVVTSALLCLTSSYEVGHTFEDFVGSAKIFEDKMSIMNFQEPMVKFILFVSPMSFLCIFGFLFRIIKLNTTIFLLSFLLIFLAGKPNMTFLSKQRLKVVTRYNFLIICGIIDLPLKVLVFDIIMVNGILYF